MLGARSETIGAVPPGVQIRPAHYEVWTRTEILKIEAFPTCEEEFHAFLHEQIGKPYDWEAIIAFAVHRNWRMHDAWFCSELIAAALESSAWFPEPLSEAVNEITPRDLLLILSPWATD